MIHIAVITAKGGNESIVDKNLIDINGKPSIFYSINAAQKSRFIADIYVSTECPKIKKYCLDNSIKIIDRPLELSQATSNHGDVIIHAYESLINIRGSIDSLTILLGNTVMTSHEDIDDAIAKAFESELHDSCMTIWKAQDDHPFRAMIINSVGYLESFYKHVSPISTNRQSYPDAYFYDQGPWVVKAKTLKEVTKSKDGPGPWWWMGKNCIPIIREWVTGRDTHSLLDVEIAQWWLGKTKN